jgi:hypothetical protein
MLFLFFHASCSYASTLELRRINFVDIQQRATPLRNGSYELLIYESGRL